MAEKNMTSSRPYLVRAIYQWIVDNDLTPYLLVDASQEGVEVPPAYVENNKIILNVSPMAAEGLALENECISFNARFSGKSVTLFIPVAAVLAIYAKENGQGMMFAEDDDSTPPPPAEKDAPKRPSLKVVK